MEVLNEKMQEESRRGMIWSLEYIYIHFPRKSVRLIKAWVYRIFLLNTYWEHTDWIYLISAVSSYWVPGIVSDMGSKALFCLHLCGQIWVTNHHKGLWDYHRWGGGINFSWNQGISPYYPNKVWVFKTGTKRDNCCDNVQVKKMNRLVASDIIDSLN